MYQNLYIHVPFCLKKCDYCAFYSISGASDELQHAWLKKLELDLSAHRHELSNPLHSLYLGGGTPTSLAPDLLQRLFEVLERTVCFAPDAERSIESNPETVTAEKAQIIGKYMNRVSLGVQSFQLETLRMLGRHTASPESVERAVALYREAGVNNLGFDLINAVPGQDLNSWRRDLRRAMALHPNHLSTYSLTVEEGAILTQRMSPQMLPADDDALAFWEETDCICAEYDFARYEISNLAKPGYQCQHNQAVWHGETYLGLGPAASSFDGVRRFTQPENLHAWLNEAPPELDELPSSARAREIFVMGLRTVRGWNAKEFGLVSGGFHWSDFEPGCAAAKSDGLLEYDGTHAAPTRQGLLFWNTLAEQLI